MFSFQKKLIEFNNCLLSSKSLPGGPSACDGWFLQPFPQLSQKHNDRHLISDPLLCTSCCYTLDGTATFSSDQPGCIMSASNFPDAIEFQPCLFVTYTHITQIGRVFPNLLSHPSQTVAQVTMTVGNFIHVGTYQNNFSFLKIIFCLVKYTHSMKFSNTKRCTIKSQLHFHFCHPFIFVSFFPCYCSGSYWHLRWCFKNAFWVWILSCVFSLHPVISLSLTHNFLPTCLYLLSIASFLKDGIVSVLFIVLLPAFSPVNVSQHMVQQMFVE